MASFTSLPGDLIAASLLPFLTGFDLFRLSHVNRLLVHGTLHANSDLWRARVGTFSDADSPPPPATSWKQFYCTHMSRRFLGASRSRQRDAAVEIDNFDLGRWENESFSFEIWFALLPEDTNTEESDACFGGVLLGAQSEDWQDEWQPEAHAIFAYVAADGGLECSVGDGERVLVDSVQPHRWYHLALTFEHQDASVGIQSVYLDGQVLHRGTTALASGWDELSYLQLATGFVGPFDLMIRSPVFAGWHDFNGVIDSFRIYESCLSPEAVAGLAQCGAPPVEPQWALDPHERGMFGTSRQIRCTRPQERVCTDIKLLTDS